MSTAKPEGMCERLFNALNTNPSFKPLRRLTFNQQNPEKQSENTTDNNSNIKTPSPTQDKPPKVAFKASPNKDTNDSRIPQKQIPTPVPVVPAPPKETKIPQKATQTPVPVVPVQPKGTEIGIPIPVPPKGAMYPKPSPPENTVGTEDIVRKPKKNINEKVEEYIHRTKNKLRSTTLARTQTTK